MNRTMGQMRSRGDGVIAWGVLLVVTAATSVVRAQDPSEVQRGGPSAEPDSTAAPSESADSRLAEAKELFRQGNELRKSGDFAGALQRYLRSRELVPSVPNTLNAAICLDKLGRLDEALELYDELISVFRDQVGAEDRQSIAAAATRLRRQVGNVDVASNVDGIVVIDGRMRGRLPLQAPIRVLPGEHVVRVVKDGWESFELQVVVSQGETRQVDARLAPLASSGRLRVDQADMAGAELYVDGAMVGTLPWEGTLAPGQHVVWLSKDEMGSQPTVAQVLQARTTTVTLPVGRLGARLGVVAEPAEARIFVDGVPVGAHRWAGRLPEGRHVFEARSEGYRTAVATVVVGQRPLDDLRLVLTVDDHHPRWRKASAGQLWVEGAGGGVGSPSMHGSAEQWCDRQGCVSRSRPSGWTAELRGGFEFSGGFGVEVGASWWQMQATVERQAPADAQPSPAYYVFHDQVRLAGPLGLLGLSWRVRVAERLDVLARVAGGVGSLASQDRVGGEIEAAGQSLPLDIEGAGASERTSVVVATPSAGAGIWFDRVRLGVDLAALWVLSEGARLGTGSAFVASGACDPARPQAIGCAKGTDAIVGERAHGRFFAIAPKLSARLRF